MAEVGLTEWNGSGATIQRIDECLRLCREARLNEDYLNLYKALIALSLEPRSKMGRKEDLELYNKYINELKSLNVLFKRNVTSFNLKQEFDSKLFDFEIFLRNFMDKKGMLMSEDTSRGL